LRAPSPAAALWLICTACSLLWLAEGSAFAQRVEQPLDSLDESSVAPLTLADYLNTRLWPNLEIIDEFAQGLAKAPGVARSSSCADARTAIASIQSATPEFLSRLRETTEQLDGRASAGDRIAKLRGEITLYLETLKHTRRPGRLREDRAKEKALLESLVASLHRAEPEWRTSAGELAPLLAFNNLLIEHIENYQSQIGRLESVFETACAISQLDQDRVDGILADGKRARHVIDARYHIDNIYANLALYVQATDPSRRVRVSTREPATPDETLIFESSAAIRSTAREAQKRAVFKILDTVTRAFGACQIEVVDWKPKFTRDANVVHGRVEIARSRILTTSHTCNAESSA
jgi:hypothetical protein